MVDAIEANPGRTIDQSELELDIDTSEVMASLPESLSEDDFIGILKLAMLTECATDTYAREISVRAREYDAGWLARFNERVWVPDEYMHAEPFKLILLNLGLAEEELDREIRDAQEAEFVHTGGDSPVHVTTFGMIQEYLTDHWHGLISRLLRPSSQVAARMTARIKQRETLHMLWYRDMTALQLESQPELIDNVAEEIARFRLPGNSIIPELQSRAETWLPAMGADFAVVARDLVRLFHTAVGSSSQRLGRLGLSLSAQRGTAVLGLKPAQVDWALQRFGGWGYGVVGEAALERAGLSRLFEHDDVSSPAGRFRAGLRTWLAQRLPLPITTPASSSAG